MLYKSNVSLVAMISRVNLLPMLLGDSTLHSFYTQTQKLKCVCIHKHTSVVLNLFDSKDFRFPRQYLTAQPHVEFGISAVVRVSCFQTFNVQKPGVPIY